MTQHPQRSGPVGREEILIPSWADATLAALASPGERPDSTIPCTPPHGGPERPAAGEQTAYEVPAAIGALSMRPRTVQRQVSARPAQRTTQRWWARLRAIAVPSNHAVRLQDAIAEVDTPVSTGRRIRVIGAHGGAGGTTVAFCMASIAAVHRRDPVALVDASTTHGGLLTRLPQAPAMSVSAAARRLNGGSTSVKSLLGAGSTPAILSPAHPDGDAAMLDAIQRHAAVTLVDDEHLDMSPADHAVVVTLENTVRGVTAAQSCIRALIAAGMPSGRVLFAVTNRVSDPGILSAWVHSELSPYDPAGIFEVPLDRHLAGAAHIHCELLSGVTYLALAELVGSAVITSTRTSAAGRDGR